MPQTILRAAISRFADESRLHRALAGTAKDRLAELPALDSDRVPAPLRASALYHLAREKNDPDLYARSVKLDPKGPYASYARFAAASAIAGSKDPAKRREALSMFLDLSAEKNQTMAEEAMTAAAALAYSDKRWNEAAVLYRRLLDRFPNGSRAASARDSAAWSCYLAARYADCLAICGDMPATDDLAYLRAAALQASDNRGPALAAYERYLEQFPAGRHRASSEKILCRAKFDDAVKAGDMPRAVEFARRAAAASGEASDGLRLAWAHERSGAIDKAAGVYASVIAKGGDGAAVGEAVFLKAMIDLRAGRRDEACRALEDFTQRFPASAHYAEALHWLGITTIQLGHDEKGAALLEKAIAKPLSPDMAREAELALADVAARAGRTGDAARRYSKLLESGAGARMSATKLAAVARLLIGEDDFAAAVRAAKALAEREKDGAWAQIAAALEGEAEEARGAFASARAAYRRARAVNAETPEGAKAALALGTLDVKAGEWDEAEKMLRDAVRLYAGPDGVGARALAYLNLAEACAGKGDLTNAVAYATIVTELFDDPSLAASARKIIDRAEKKGVRK